MWESRLSIYVCQQFDDKAFGFLMREIAAAHHLSGFTELNSSLLHSEVSPFCLKYSDSGGVLLTLVQSITWEILLQYCKMTPIL